VFVDIVSSKRSEYELIEAETGLYSNPPDDLLAFVVWDGDAPDELTMLHVWRTPDARGEFAFRKIMPLAQAGKVNSVPKRLKPIRVFLRDGAEFPPTGVSK
jgi:hypothetical protein